MKRWLTIILISILATMFIYPSAFIYPQDTLPDNNDTRLIAYIIGQVQENILEHRPLHYGTFFAPDQSTLAYSDLFLTSAVLTLPFRLFTNSPIAIFNLALVLNFALTIISSYLLFGYFFKDHWITALTVILFNFSGFHLSYLPHLQIFSLWPLCLSIYFFTRYLNENRTSLLLLFYLSVTAQIAESILPAYLIFFTCILIVIAHAIKFRSTKNVTDVAEVPAKSRAERIHPSILGKEVEHGFLRSSKRRHFLFQILISSLPFVPLWIFLLLPYYQLHTSLPEATRPIRDAAHFSLGLDQIFTFYHSWTVIILLAISLLSSQIVYHHRSQSRPPILKRLRNAKKHGFSVLRGFFAARQDGPAAGRRAVRFSKWVTMKSDQGAWILVLIFSLVMSLGPVLKIFGQNLRLFGFPIPLPYALFYYLFPGFTGFRTPSRFIVLALISVVIIIGFQLKPIFGKLKPKTKLIFILLTLSLLFVEADLPLKSYPVNINMHPVYQEVTNLHPDAVILELPVKLWNMPDHEIESIRSLYTLFHKHRRFGGFSGFATNRWIDLVQKINAYGLTPPIVESLRSLGITHVIQNNKISGL